MSLRGMMALICALSLLGAPGAAQAQEAPKYTIKVVLGDGARNNVKKGRATSRATVEVRDENDRPVAGAYLTFTAPNNGPSVKFLNGQTQTTAQTGANGQASVAYDANSVAGDFQISVSGTHQGVQMSTVIAQTNIALAAAGGLSGAAIALIVAAAAGGGIAAAVAAGGGGGRTTPGPGPAPPTPTPGITITVGGTPGFGPPR